MANPKPKPTAQPKQPSIHPPIIIVGAARSGTSMTAGVIALSGAWGGKTVGPSKANPKGMFENTQIREQILKPYLRQVGADPRGQHPLPLTHELPHVTGRFAERHRERVHNAILGQGYPGGPWYYKGAKVCLVWPLWAAAFPDARFIIVRRDAEDIVRSCLRTSFMSTFRNRSGWLGWVAAHERKFEEMIDARLNVREMWPQRLIDGDFTEAQTVVQWLGLKWDGDAAREFVDPGLWKRGRR